MFDEIALNGVPVAQEHPLGCAVACVASRCELTYDEALALFKDPSGAWTRGFYCPEIVEAFARAGYVYGFAEYLELAHRKLLSKPGTLVFVAPSLRYVHGHFLLRVRDGWMNPWANCPRMVPVEAEIQQFCSGEIAWVLFEK